MKNPDSRLLIVFSLVLLMLFASGCSKTYFKSFEPQSHFEYPNSNVIPLGKVSGEATRSGFFTYPFVDSDLMKEAIQSALRKNPEADILLNFMSFETRSDLLFIHSLTYRVEGTAAKMEIGTQKLY